MMTFAELAEGGVEIEFADGAKGTIPYSEIPGIKSRSEARAIGLSNRYELIIETVGREPAVIPWDFARHYCDESYRPAVEKIAERGRAAQGARIRRHRLSKGLTRRQLASRAGLSRSAIAQLENGKVSPRYETVKAIARALEVAPVELLTDPRWLTGDG